MFDYPEGFDRNLISISELPLIKIEEVFTVFGKTFTLMAMIYFQGMRYTCNINGVYHKTLIPRTNKWFYHNGKQEERQNHLVCSSLKIQLCKLNSMEQNYDHLY